jgi:hypothetical protein
VSWWRLPADYAGSLSPRTAQSETRETPRQRPVAAECAALTDTQADSAQSVASPDDLGAWTSDGADQLGATHIDGDGGA